MAVLMVTAFQKITVAEQEFILNKGSKYAENDFSLFHIFVVYLCSVYTNQIGFFSDLS